MYTYVYVSIVQEIAVKETFLEQRVRVGLHCIVGGLMHLLSHVVEIPVLQSHVETVCVQCIAYVHMHTYMYVHTCLHSLFKPDVRLVF